MGKLVILCLVLYISKTCCFSENNNICLGEPFSPTTVTLLNNKGDKTNEKINKRFIEIVQKSGMNVKCVNHGEPLVDEPLKVVLEKYDNKSDILLHLYVPDFYQHDYNDIKKLNFTYVGDIGDFIEHDVCKSKPAAGLETCEKTTETERHVKLASKSIHDHKPILDLVTTFDGESGEAMQCLNVVVCDDGFVIDTFPVRRYDDIADCEDAITEGTLAVFAPKPFQLHLNEQLYTPTIFYEHNYVSPETNDKFVNAFSVVNSKEIMKFAFLHFLIQAYWFRVGIISDHSLDSQEFERDITSLLEQEHFVYGSLLCSDENFNCNEVFTRFSDGQAKVMIANIREESALTFAMQVARSKLGQRNIVWLVRDWPPRVAKTASKKMGNIFSMTLRPENSTTAHSPTQRNTNQGCPEYALQIVANLISEIDIYDLIGADNKRVIAEEIQRRLYNQVKVAAYVNKFVGDDNAELVAKVVNPTRYSYRDREGFIEKTAVYIQPEFTDCYFINNIYFKQCDDIEIVLLMLVCSIFMLTAIGIVYFFQTYDTSYSRMEC